MSQQNVEVAKRMVDAFNRGDRDAMFADHHHDVEWRALQQAPDSPERLSGVDALLAHWDRWEDAFDDITAEIEEYIDCGECVLAVTHWRAKGKDSGLPIERRSVDTYEFAHGKIVRLTVGYPDKDAALKAVGLAE